MTIEYIYVAALTAAVAALWVWFKTRSDACEKDRKMMWHVISILSGTLRAIKSCPTAGCAFRTQADEALRDVDEEMDVEKVKTQVLKDVGVSYSVSTQPAQQ